MVEHDRVLGVARARCPQGSLVCAVGGCPVPARFVGTRELEGRETERRIDVERTPERWDINIRPSMSSHSRL